jgi:hypothetical protein
MLPASSANSYIVCTPWFTLRANSGSSSFGHQTRT